MRDGGNLTDAVGAI